MTSSGTPGQPRVPIHTFHLSDLWIRTKDRRKIRFEPNEVQVNYLDLLLPDWRECPVGLRGVREILLKGRQFGLSTLILALFFLDTIATPQTHTVVVAHDADSTERLFQIVQRFYDNLPPERRPRTRFANRREYLWPDIDSSFFVGTAGARDFGRGGTINNVHASEVASWPSPEELVAGLLEAVPADGNVFIETTAKGLGNWFHVEYGKAQIGDSVFAPRFFSWANHSEYRQDPGPDFERTEEEWELADAYGLNDAQLAWRRQKIKALREDFPQEYPLNPEQAFLTSGNPYFDRDYLSELLPILPREYPPIPVVAPGRLRNVTGLEVWELPKPGRLYVIGADTAEGINEWGDHDYDAADVFDAGTWAQVAHLHGRWDTREYGLLLAVLGTWYNTALLGVERNNHGHAVINAIMHEADYPLQGTGNVGGLYLHEEYDQAKKLESRRPGWPATPKSKFLALDTLATLIDNREIALRSQVTVREMLTYVKKTGGKAGGEGRSHDDAVSSAYIAAALLTLQRGGGFAPLTAGENPLITQYRPR